MALASVALLTLDDEVALHADDGDVAAARQRLGAGGIITEATPVRLNFAHGTVAGNRVYFDTNNPTVQLVNPKVSPGKGLLMVECDLHFIRNDYSFTYF